MSEKRIFNCMCVTLLFILIMTGFGLLFVHGASHNKKISYAKCRKDTILDIGRLAALRNMNETVTITEENPYGCVRCDAGYEMAAMGFSDNEVDGCVDHQLVKGECCIKISHSKRNMSFDAIFGSFVALFVIAFAFLWYFLDAPYSEKETAMASSKSTAYSYQGYPAHTYP